MLVRTGDSRKTVGRKTHSSKRTIAGTRQCKKTPIVDEPRGERPMDIKRRILPKARFEQIEFLDERAVLTDMKARRGKGNLQRLEAEAKKRGYEPLETEDEVFGLRQKFEVREPIRPGSGESGTPVVEMEFELVMQSLRKGDSRDHGAIAVATIRAGRNVETQEILLEAPEGKFLEAREFVFEGDQLIETESWWTAIWRCLLSSCGPVIAGALIACSGSFIAYVGCVLVAAGGCGVKCAACATCN